jgi:hypothetical protein
MDLAGKPDAARALRSAARFESEPEADLAGQIIPSKAANSRDARHMGDLQTACKPFPAH